MTRTSIRDRHEFEFRTIHKVHIGIKLKNKTIHLHLYRSIIWFARITGQQQ